MGELFDNLLGMLPAVLFFLFIMRRLFGRRGGARKTEGAESGRDTDGEVIKRDQNAEPSAAARIMKVLGTAGEALGVSAYSAGTSRPGGSPEDKPRREDRTQKVPSTVSAEVSPTATAPRASELNRRAAARSANPVSNPDARKGRSRKSSSLLRIEELPPPARGVVWGLILGEPPGMKEL